MVSSYLFMLAEGVDENGDLITRFVTIQEFFEAVHAKVRLWKNSPEFLAQMDAEYDAAFNQTNAKTP